MKYIIMMFLLMSCVRSHYVSNGVSNINRRVIGIWIDSEFSETDNIEISLCISEWNYGMNGLIRLEILGKFDMEVRILEGYRRRGEWLILKIDGAHDFGKSKALGFVDNIGGSKIFIVRDRLSEDMIRGVMLHEVGHLLGLEHGSGLMYWRYDRMKYSCIDSETMLKLGLKYGVGLERLNYCN